MGERFCFAFSAFPLSLASLRNGPERSRARGLCAATRTLDGEDRSGTWSGGERRRGVSGSGRNSPAGASNLPAMAELSPQDYIQSTKPAVVSIYEENDHGPCASHQEAQIATWPQIARGPIVSVIFGSM